MFFAPLSKTPILQKSLFFLRKIAIFLVLSLQKSTKFRRKKAFENDIEKKGSNIDFWGPFGFPKSSKIGPRSDIKRSLFCDAMQIARKSSQGNGTQSFWTTNMATHMIRSSLSLYLNLYAYIYIYIYIYVYIYISMSISIFTLLPIPDTAVIPNT